MTKQLLFAAASLLCASQAFAVTEYWVSPNGNDENPGTQAKPFATPLNAVLYALPNDETIIHLEKDATFMTDYTITVDQDMIISIVGDNTTLQASEKPPYEYEYGKGTSVRTLKIGKNSKVKVSGVNFLYGRQVEYLGGGGIFFEGDELTVEHCLFKECESGVGGAAIMSHGRVVRVADCVFDGCYAIGGAARGAAIVQRGYFNESNEPMGELYVERCAFANNKLKAGGQGTAIDIYDNSIGIKWGATKKLVVVNSTFAANTSTDPYQAAIDIAGFEECETYLVNNTFNDLDGALRLYNQHAPVYLINNFAYCNRACVLSELSIADGDRHAITAHNNIFYGKERSVNENIDDPDLNSGAAAASNTLGMTKDASLVQLGVSKDLGTRDQSFVPFLPILRANSPLVAAGVKDCSQWTGDNYVPADDIRGWDRKADVNGVCIGAYQLNASGIGDIYAEPDYSNAPVEYYNLQGIRVANPENGIFIRRQGNKTTKVIL